ncbi:NAD-dependent epimerase/dehydratase family protein [Paenibacillus sepulcri]|uniref:NAD-dependent epimerase/dehydratase family protein n=1 Tax=Paenibacillus sepulcri TaxID=359917 RepID=A0ABS7C1I9_9BACL|nr:NAD-dependent epimerase/dehydratase family protein [Paenibacillus sepulcri]
MNMQKGDLCLVTGISGYLASWIGHYLIEEGYRVRGTVRSLNNREQLEKMSELLPGIEFVEADLRKENGWDQAVDGVKWVFHVASPQAVKTETDRIGGATKGTEFLMNAALGSDTVKKVVITSSEAAVAYGHPSSKTTFNEDDWTDANGPGDYFRSKTRAERIAWDIARDQTRNPKQVALSTINPSMILGPSLVPWARFSSETVKNIAEGKMPMIPDMTVYYVDVRDCARMHIAIMNDPKTNGHRHLSMAARGKYFDLAELIRDNYSQLGYKVTSRVAPHFLLWIMKFFSADVASIYSKLRVNTVMKTKYPNVYKYKHTHLLQMVRDTMDNLIASGIIEPRGHISIHIE